ncbi:hypothetical protein GCM10007231_33000 [Nocardioides daphniae]|uniref:LamG-like jellyroll fold domain-containing protein n=1 Tax=Nocardioides daphniae TaxID=402297 RepID=A0ABQ1QK43_9ACTN|nr:hypothetical protein GCM10007231_33000 [Nocardioides daphniae]
MRKTRAFRSAATVCVAGAVLTGSLSLVPSLAVAAVAPSTYAPHSALTLAPASLPGADVLDVDLADGSATDRAQALKPELVGEPVFTADASRARSIISFNGSTDAVKYPFRAEHAKLAQGFAVECVFRYDAPTKPTSEKALCSAKEGGGFALVANTAGVTFMTHVGGGYKNASAPLTPGQWYHTVSVWDGTSVKLYVNGELARTTAAAGAYKAPTAGADSLVLGGDTQPGNGVDFRAQASIQTARIYTQPIDATAVKALADAATSVPEAPAADVFDVDFADGTAKDVAGGLTPQAWNNPEVVDYAPLGRKVGRFDGSSAYYYPFSEKYDAIKNTMSIECVFKYDADAFQAGGAESSGNLCASKEAGGFSITLYGDEIAFNPHVGGAYRNTKTRITETDRWHHVVGTYDGTAVRLYVNGALKATTPVTGTVSRPTPAGAEMMVVGGDASNGKPGMTAPAHIASARIFSRALPLKDVLALQAEAFGQRDASALVTLKSSVPAAGQRLTAQTEVAVELNNAEAVSRHVTYAVDGREVEPGDLVGAGFKAGRHTLTVDGKDHFGNVIAERVEFTSANIPTSGGTETGQARGEVTLSAIATNPSGGDVTTTFRRGEVVTAEGGTQGTLDAIPTTVDFTTPDAAPITGDLVPGDSLLVDSPSARALSYQRFDLEVGSAADGEEVTWTGTVDPTRSAVLRLWNGTKWVVATEARGVANGATVLRADLRPAHVHGGKVPVLLTAEDAFADDLDEPVRDAFEKPDDYDFSIAHLTDTQYLSEGAVEQETPEERARWKEAYTSATQWIADNAAGRKIAFAAHTGDIIENWHNATSGSNPAYRANAVEEFKVADEAQKILDDAGVVNSVLPGNHDNLYGTDTGPDALYNDWFGPERYEALESRPSWGVHDASYHPWKPGDNSNSFNLFSASGLDFIVVNLGFGVDEEETAWANQVLEQYKDRNAIVQTHAHVTPSSNPDGRGGNLSYDGNKVRNQVAAKNPNVFLVLAGHEHGVNIETVRNLGSKGNHVVEMLADYQFYTVSAGQLGMTGMSGYADDTRLQFGSSFFRLLQFDVDRAEVSVDTYSALLDEFGATEYDNNKRYNGHEDDFRLPVQLETRTNSLATDGLTVVRPTDEVIGTDTARSGWPAEVTWGGLEDGTTYAWYAVSSDASSGDELPGSVGQMALFTANGAGTDKVAPVVFGVDPATVTHGSTFDPLAGVGATDNTDGVVTADVQVVGEVDTTRVGTYTLVYSVADANGNQTVVTRTVEVVAPPAPVNTHLPSIAGSGALGSVLHASNGQWENLDPAEVTVQWFRNGVEIAGARDNSHLVTAADQGRTLTVQVSAKVVGHDPVVVRSAAFEVPAAEKPVVTRKASRVALSVPKRVKASQRATVTVKVTGAPRATGKVTIKVDGKKVRTVVLKASQRGTVKVRLPKLKRGQHTVVATYAGDRSLRGSTSKRVTFRVVR